MGLSRIASRVAFLAVVRSASVLLFGFLTAPTISTVDDEESTDFSEPVVEPRDGVTVVAADSHGWVADEGDGPRAELDDGRGET